MIRLLSLVACCTIVAAPMVAQHEHAAPGDSIRSPYAGFTSRDIKALSEEEVAGLLAGEGMGYALPGELNGYPGPKHVLDAAQALGLSPEVMTQIQTVRDSMLAAATRLGRQIVDAERRLDRAFASRHIDDAQLWDATQAIAILNGQLRYVHLRTHLAVTKLLTPEQIERYQELRGYRP